MPTMHNFIEMRFKSIDYRHNISMFMINVYIAFVYSHISYAADLDLNTYESSFDKLTKVE